MITRPQRLARPLALLVSSLFAVCLLLAAAQAQTEVTGAFQGTVRDSVTKNPIPNATVRFINQDTQTPSAKRTNNQGEFYQGNLNPGRYEIVVEAQGYKTQRVLMSLPTMRSTVVIPVPVTLVPDVMAQATPATPPTATPPTTDKPAPPVTPPVTAAPVGPIVDSVNITAELYTPDARRGGTFAETEVAALPLGGATFTRSFDELALLLPGVALPPQTQGSVAGPGVGPGVGSAGQFAINGLRSRSNNFTVDGSDNNDEDIGVRRQGFFTLVPQSIESIKEYQITTALAPAQYGRNLGAQVNAVSRSGGYQTHGNFYGFFNSSQLNEPDYFDTKSTGQPTRLQGLLPSGTARDVFVNGQPLNVVNPAAGQDSVTFGQAGFVLGGTLLPRPATGEAAKSAFYLLSFEGQILNANKERSFAVPTVEERGLNGSGAAGICSSGLIGTCAAGDRRGFPTSFTGDAIFSLFPFPNNPNGIYGRNTFTQILPASAQGNIASVKFDHNFRYNGRQQSATARYNRTDDWRNIPATGGALFATLRPTVRTNNFSFFLNSELTGPNAMRPVFNQLRASYGRTRLLFEEERDTSFLIPSGVSPSEPFLLNAPLLTNDTLPSSTLNYVDYRRANGDVESLGRLGRVGQVIIAGYSALGVDVFNFPQQRVNNTYQLADTLSVRAGAHSLTFGGDFRRTDLNSDLPRNARPYITFGSAPAIGFNNQGLVAVDSATGNVVISRRFTNPVNRASSAAPNNVSQTLALTTSNIGLRYYQLNFFAQDEWRVRPNLALSFGLRYEYNTPPREVDELIERTFKDARLSLLPNLQQFLKNREQIFDPDRNNFAPRVGLSYSRNIFGTNATVFRAGYGIFYDQALGAVVSQSRNVFPNFLTLNTGGGLGAIDNTQGRIGQFGLFNPTRGGICFGGSDAQGNCVRFEPFVVSGTLSQYNQNGIPLDTLVSVLNRVFPGEFGFTLPDKELPLPMAQHYALTIEQQMGPHLVLSAAYVGTRGENLLRLTTPNLGPNLILAEGYFDIPPSGQPVVFGYRLIPGQVLRPNPNSNINPNHINTLLVNGQRPVAGLGTVYLYQATAESRYDSLQLQLRGRYRGNLQMQISYTYAKALDDVSDVFDLAGASALPQNSFALDNERGPANFDVRHRVSSSFVYLFPTLTSSGGAKRFLFGGFELAGSVQYQTAQPFTINSLHDINFDGNYTDRLNTTEGIIIARDNNRQPVQFGIPVSNINSTLPLLAAFGQDGAVGRNTFRGADYFLANLALTKNFIINERHRIIFRTEAFNLFDTANFGIPVRFLEAPAFGQATDTVTPGRRIQFALKYTF